MEFSEETFVKSFTFGQMYLVKLKETSFALVQSVEPNLDVIQIKIMIKTIY